MKQETLVRDTILNVSECSGPTRIGKQTCVCVFLRAGQVTRVQLETLKIENQHLSDLLERVEKRSPQVSASCLKTEQNMISLSLDRLELVCPSS